MTIFNTLQQKAISEGVEEVLKSVDSPLLNETEMRFILYVRNPSNTLIWDRIENRQAIGPNGEPSFENKEKDKNND